MQWMSPQERTKRGHAQRKVMPRQEHAEFDPGHRKVTPARLLKASDRGRVPALVKIKHERMAMSPFGFFRGAVAVMAADLGAMKHTGIMAQLCGDAHVRNLGAFAAEDGRLIFDINDFDETYPGPFEWDLKRLAASLVVAGREAGNKEGVCAKAVKTFAASYSERMRIYAPMPMLEIVRDQISRFDEVAPVHAALRKAVRSTPLSILQQLTAPEPGTSTKGPGVSAKASGTRRQFKEIKPVLTRMTGAVASLVKDSLEPYRETLESQRRHFLDRYRALDVAFKVVGTGSVGLRDYCIYLEGNGEGDPLFLQVKEETRSAYAPYLSHRRVAKHQGQRVLEGQRLMQTGTDILLGYTRIEGRDYLVRRLNDHKASIDLEDLKGGGLTEYAQLCGELLARGHARSGDACEIAGYLGSGEGFAAALARFARAYADQTEKDWEEFRKGARG